jgi:NTE family protein
MIKKTIQDVSTALVLTAGGARGAYQAGVLKRIGELPGVRKKGNIVDIIVGASAGAINGAAIASNAKDFTAATQRLADLWGNLKTRSVFKPDLSSLTKLAGIWLKDLSMGGLLGGGNAQSLLDSSPLKELLTKELDLEKIQDSIDSGHLYAFAVAATNYYSGVSYTFIQGCEGHATWNKSRKVSVSTKISYEHILASSSIPIVFPPVLVPTPEGDFYFGDGALRLTNPIGPAIRLGADKVLSIGIRCQHAAKIRAESQLFEPNRDRPVMKKPPLAQVVGVTLNSIFLDHLDTDVEHLVRMNDILRSLGKHQYRQAKSKEPIRIVEPLIINPSIDLASIAEEHANKMPAVIRYFLEGLGASKTESADLMSYLLFDSAYTKDLIRVGYEDASQRVSEIEKFLLDSEKQ